MIARPRTYAALIVAISMLGMQDKRDTPSGRTTPVPPELPSLTVELSAPSDECVLIDVPLMIEVRIRNAGTKSLAALTPRNLGDLIDRRAPLQLTVMDSSDVLVAPPRSDKANSVAVSLPPSAYWGFAIDLREITGDLPPDVYRLRAEYEVPTARADPLSGESSASPVWKGRSWSTWQTLRIAAPDQERVVQEYSKRWKASRGKSEVAGGGNGNRAGSSGDLRALRWLAANVLDAGVPARRVRDLLGEPESTGADESKWTYRAGANALMLRMHEEVVTNIEFGER